MRNIFIFVILILVNSITGWAQPDSLWSRTYGGDAHEQCSSLQQTTDEGYVLAGQTYSYGPADCWLVKTDMNGDTIWTHTYGGIDMENCRAVQQTGDGGYILAGYTESFGAGYRDFWMVKTDASGDSLWSRTFGGYDFEDCNSVQQTDDGGYILAGCTETFGSGDRDFWMVKTDVNGDSLWSRAFGGIGYEDCNSVAITDDGGYVLVGQTSTWGQGDRDFWVVKTAANGDSMWSRTFGGDQREQCYGVIQTADGGYALAGYTNSFGPDSTNFWLVKMDANGDSLWSRAMDSGNLEKCKYLQQTIDGGYVLAGSTNQIDSDSDFWLVKTDAAGNSVWNRTFGTAESEQCFTVALTTDGGYALGGSRYAGYDFLNDMWLVKTGPDLSIDNPPSPFTRLMPADSSALVWMPWESTIEFTWTTSHDPNGDDVSYNFHLESPTYYSGLFSMSDTVTSDTTVTVEMYMVDALDEIHEFYWTVHAEAGFDTIEASNGAGFFTMDLPGTTNDQLTVPTNFNLSVFPNPFNSTATLQFSIPQAGPIQLMLYDVTGRKIRSMTSGFFPVGEHEITVEAAELPSGVLFARLTGEGQTITRKLVLMR